VHGVEEFAAPENWPALLPHPVDALIDACDQVRAKQALAAWALREHVAFVCVGAAGGKQVAQAIEIDDLAAATHDPLLASLRQRLRQQEGAARKGAIGVRCVFSRERVQVPDGPDGTEGECVVDGSLNCSGYGSSVTVTGTFGFAAAGEVLRQLLSAHQESAKKLPL
jgi:tRNA A37 threonylcarbamoyladenosine dehydratase